MTREAPGPDRFGGAAPQGPRHETIDLYELLEVSPRASGGVIHAAYRTLVRNVHPDHNASPEASQRIRQLNAAYRVLGDPQGRARYDLESARARRSERLNNVPRSPIEATVQAEQPRALSMRAALMRRGADERVPLINGQVLLGLLAVVVVVTIVIMLLWASVDPDPNAPVFFYPGDSTELMRR